MLNIRCSVHPKLFNMPPQEQGTYGLSVIIKVIYAVNININVNAANNDGS